MDKEKDSQRNNSNSKYNQKDEIKTLQDIRKEILEDIRINSFDPIAAPKSNFSFISK